jgi:uncharacterized protein YyaL (SSP411 family)
MSNRLAAEQSPYLLQHKNNPVDWYPWGDEAFAKARAEDKPIFLSVGYSTCHWCHVMEHESFENAQVADVINRHFVSIKVDREERPDVDRVYMTFVQATTGSGGWPMSVWLTPALEPFYGGTYFPPASRWGRPGFVEVLEEIARVWSEEREKVTRSASGIVGRLKEAAASAKASAAKAVPGVEALDAAVRQFGATFDARRGGFGDAPKFPRPSELLFLLREHARTGQTEPRDMVLVTLRAMAFGGMRDHIGGGFHRYSVDGDWRVPHFEKMLYDQAQLVLAYVEAAQATGEAFYADVAADTLEYVMRDLVDPAGGFHSAEDADSIPPEHAADPHPHKMEGAFYIWRDDEIRDALGADAEVFRLRFGVLPDGNAPFDPQAEFTHKNLLYTAQSIEEIASTTKQSAVDVAAVLGRARATLLAVRGRRPRPHLDDKVLTAWNGLMIAAFARAGRVLPDAERYLASATRAAMFLKSRMWDGKTLLRRYRAGDASIEGYAEDYAYLIFGLLELFQAGGNPQWLEWALALQQRQDELFWDPVEGGWFSTTGTDPSVLLRLKEEYDGAEPAASSVSALNLLALAHLTGAEGFSGKAEQVIGSFGARLVSMSRGVPMMLAALSTYHAGMPQIVIVGRAEEDDTRALIDAVRSRYRPTAVTVRVDPARQADLSRVLPWIGAMGMRDGRATAYVCREFACRAPTTDPAALAAEL